MESLWGSFEMIDGVIVCALLLLFFWQRQWAIALASVWAVFLLQSGQGEARVLFSVGSLFLVSTTWLFSRDADQRLQREDSLLLAAMVVFALVEAVQLNRRIAFAGVLVGLPVGIIATLIIDRLITNRTFKLASLIAVIVIIFIVLKSAIYDQLGNYLDTFQATTWFGFSYIAFRLIHTLLDQLTGQLPPVTLRQYVSYAVFFPTLTAGPIDRVERFVPEYEKPYRPQDHSHLVEGAYRVLRGLIRKFVIADTLALFALSASNTGNSDALWTWVQLYLYAFQIFFDFSGYTDMAIGVGLFFGIKLPENFDRPYFKRNLSQFWQSWHITLSSWVRFYLFTPLSRYLIRIEFMSSVTVQVLISQVATMLIIGLWHGITINFAIWGIWHGLGLFIQKVWSDATRRRYIKLRQRPRLQRWVHGVSTVTTFQFVCLGWVWFALPEVDMALKIYSRLFGMG